MKIAPAVMEILERASADETGITLTGQLDRELYVSVGKVLSAAGWTWDRKAKRHLHPTASGHDALESMLSLGEVVSARDIGFFETTGVALAMLVEAGDVRDQIVLEPSAGTGNVVRACVEAGAQRVDVVEWQDSLRARLNASVPLHIYREPDFLCLSPTPVYGRVVMNPPFATPGRPRADMDHVEHARRFVKPGGKLAAIMAAGVLFRQDSRTDRFHERIADCSPSLIPLAEGSFRASGTPVNTCLLTLELVT